MRSQTVLFVEHWRISGFASYVGLLDVEGNISIYFQFAPITFV